MKTKGQQPLVVKLELLAFACDLGGLAERLNATDCKSVNGARNTVQGFKSLTRRQINTPTAALTAAGAKIHTTEAARTRKPIMWLLFVDLKGDFTDDVPQLPDRM